MQMVNKFIGKELQPDQLLLLIFKDSFGIDSGGIRKIINIWITSKIKNSSPWRFKFLFFGILNQENSPQIIELMEIPCFISSRLRVLVLPPQCSVVEVALLIDNIAFRILLVVIQSNFIIWVYLTMYPVAYYCIKFHFYWKFMLKDVLDFFNCSEIGNEWLTISRQLC